MKTLLVMLLCQTFAGGERENYLRYLQTLRLVPMYPWGLRAFSPAEATLLSPGDSAHPWAAREEPRTWLPVSASARVNTTFPYGYNDGPIWAGRGVTLAAQGGFAVRRGVVSLTVAPLAFIAQNARFPLMASSFADGSLAQTIDRPQRFGNGSYARLDPGESTLRLDWRKLSAGVTTASQYWGPASDFPILLGNNAAGFPHAFLGTARPVDLWVLRVHSRMLWGRLEQSAFSAETTAAGARFATGIVVDLTSRWLPGLEIGAARFSHQAWRPGGPSLDDVLAMVQGTETGLTAVNQLASAFFRWVLPHSGFEVYGEYGRDDYNANGRDFLLEPDHIGGYTIGFRKVMRRSGRLLAVRTELQNLQLSSLAQGRLEVPFYTHGALRQGHTERGQVLGSEAGPGGAGSVVAIESFSPSGRWTWSWTRMLRQQRGDASGASPDPDGVDVQHALAVERLQFHGRYEVLARASAIYELNRNFGGDSFNVNLVVGLRAQLAR